MFVCVCVRGNRSVKYGRGGAYLAGVVEVVLVSGHDVTEGRCNINSAQL